MTFLDLVLTNLSEFVTQTLGSKTFFRLISSGDELCAAASLGWGQPTPQWQNIVSAGVSKNSLSSGEPLISEYYDYQHDPDTQFFLRIFCPTIVHSV